ncbi:hypothetical protein [Streptomyces sp. 8P21H-1]|uniref:hypothetical protein n=1 Tax=Streptomyces sp. 8P21H-1 TaxID=2737048 RepID=UPI001570F509|nr:hypothetical protein [Streptomyces sp. 8P21H-1]NSL42956.1 hypothetical protein [Streptomyces sp. 8P21H-1]
MSQGNSKKIKSLIRVLVISAGPAVVTLVFGALATGSISWFPVLVGVVAILFLSTWQMTTENRTRKTVHMQEKRAEQAERELRRAATFDAGVQPVTQWLGKIFQGEGDYETLRRQILDKLTETAVQLVDPDALCAFYRLDAEHDRLALEAHTGPPGVLPDAYSGNDGNGSYLLYLAKTQNFGPEFVLDIDAAPNGGTRIRLINGYKTALFLPVWTGSAPQGLIVIQAMRPGQIPAPQSSQILDGNYRKFYTITSLIGLPQTRNRPNG